MADSASDWPAGVRPRGDSIQIRYQYKGREYNETLDKRPNKTNIAYAAKIRQQRLDDLRLGRIDEEWENPSFGILAQQYLDTAKVTRSTRDCYRHALNKYWMPKLAKLPIRSITYKDLWQLDSRLKWPSAKTRKNAIVPLRQVFRLAKKHGYAESNPAKELEQEKHQKPPIDPFTRYEKESILAQLDGQAFIYFTLAFETGARTSELLALTWDDYDGKRLAINKSMVRREVKLSTKTNMAREVLLTERAKGILRECPTRFKGGPIFTHSLGGPCLDADGFNRSWRQALSDAGIRYRRGYNCRHTYASLGLTAGAKPGFLCQQLGHTLEMFFNTYAKYIKSEDDELELAKIDAYKKMDSY